MGASASDCRGNSASRDLVCNPSYCPLELLSIANQFITIYPVPILQNDLYVCNGMLLNKLSEKRVLKVYLESEPSTLP